jgi:hypothetical protein
MEVEIGASYSNLYFFIASTYFTLLIHSFRSVPALRTLTITREAMAHNTNINAATQVFNIPELVELILMALPCDTTHVQLSSMRTIFVARSTSSTWDRLLYSSTLLRQRLYLPTCLDRDCAAIWAEKTAFPPAEPNPWIPFILLNQRSWGSAWPFETYTAALFEGLSPSKPKFWTFSLELSRAQYARLPPAGAWRELLCTKPPFTDFWYTRAFYELGSGRAPFVTHIDYNAKVPKTEQKYRVHCPEGVKLGDIVDAFSHLFGQHPAATFVMIESLRPQTAGGAMTVDERPLTRLHYPGSSAEKVHGWQREAMY